MSLTISACVLALMQSVTGAEFLNVILLLLSPPPAANAATGIVPLTSIYASL